VRFITARNLDKAVRAAALLQEENINAISIELDVTNSEHITAIVKFIEKTYGKLDVLVNNAGVYLDHLGSTTDMMHRSFETNVFGPHALIEALLPALKASPLGICLP
jgi:NAD(P)-dependent dehydrogenase (short-subunit alcohol dehydrogenase family)